ncbi:MAG: GNAT family N-acetyltransferase [Clostridia bacterium]|nr:GNAT family N-acetyltransferase [Clostridia bacterium]
MELTNGRLRVFSLLRSQLERYVSAPREFLDSVGICGELPDGQDMRSFKSLLEKCGSEDMQWCSVFLITDKEEHTLYGHVCFCGLIEKQNVEIGYRIYDQYRNKGIMTEALKLISSEALRDPDITKVTAFCEQGNVASARVLEKNRFRLKKSGDVLQYVKRSEQRTFPILVGALVCSVLGGAIGHFAFGHLHEGLNIGIFLGLAIGAAIAFRRNHRKI